MKNFMVIHFSQNWIFDPHISRFETKKEARDYVHSFRGSLSHKNDKFEIVEVLAQGEAVQTKDGQVRLMET